MPSFGVYTVRLNKMIATENVLCYFKQAKRDSDTLAPASIVSFPDSCARVEILPIIMVSIFILLFRRMLRNSCADSTDVADRVCHFAERSDIPLPIFVFNQEPEENPFTETNFLMRTLC